MKWSAVFLMRALVLLVTVLAPAKSQAPSREVLSLPLRCTGGDCPLLNGKPATAGMRSGFVRLRPGESVGWHSTEQNEESLVMLQGQGEAIFEGRPKQGFAAPRFLYIPPATRHNVTNTGGLALEYIYVVAPAK